MLKKLTEIKKEREEEQQQYVKYIRNLRHIEVKGDGTASFAFDLELKDLTCRIFLYKDGVMIPYSDDMEMKHCLRTVDKKLVFTIKDLMPEDAGVYQVDVEEVNVFSTEFKIPNVDFIVKIQEVKAMEREDALFECVLSQPLPKIGWLAKNVPLENGDKYRITVSDDKLIHRLLIKDCLQLDKGIYTAVAGIKTCSAWLVVEDPGVQFVSGLSNVNALFGQATELSCKLNTEKGDGTWFKEGKQLTNEDGITIAKDGACHKLIINSCQEEHSGKYRFEAHGRKTEAIVTVQDPPRIDSKDLSKFSEPVTVKAGQNATFKLPFAGHEPIKIQWYREGEELQEDTNVKIEKTATYSRLLLSKCQRKQTGEIKIRLKNDFGTTEAVSKLSVLVFPGAPAAPKVVSAFAECITLTWTAPSNTGGSHILGYNLEKRKRGSNLWSAVNPSNEPIQEKKYAVKDVVAGMEYEFRVSAINASGVGEPSVPCDFVTARDPKKSPGKVRDLKVTEATYTSVSLSWTKPVEERGAQDEAKGYFVEIRPAESLEWIRCNTSPIILTSLTVKGLKSMAMYWVRVLATNEGGDGPPQDLDNYILAMPPPVRPRFTDRNLKSFMVVRAGNTVRITVNFEASPVPDVEWLKDGVPVSKRVTISNSDGASQLLIPSSERTDTGTYTIAVNNMVGQETFSIEVRVTDEPKPPGPVELEENVPGTVTVTWEPSPDEKRDDRLHYMVSQRDSTKRTWHMVADRLFNNKFTACNIMAGREYHFRIYAKNDMGMSAPSESPTWGTNRKREKFVLNLPHYKDCDLQSAPSFLVPLKFHTAPKGYECYMSCAVRGNPNPRITWYRNNVSINTNTNYYISNTCGVCSLLILRVGPKDVGEYTISAENALGRAECTTKLSVRADNLMGMQMKMVKLQSFQEEMRKANEKQLGPDGFEHRLHTLEESYALAQKQVGMALATAEQLKTSDLPAQVLTLHTEMKARLAEVQKAAVSAEQLAQLQVSLREKSLEFEEVKQQVEGLAGASTELAQSVEGLSSSLAASEVQLEQKAATVEVLSSQIQTQTSDLLELKKLLANQQIQLEKSMEEIAIVKELLETERIHRSQQANVEEQLSSVHQSLQEQNSAAQNLHTELSAQLESIQSQVSQLDGGDQLDSEATEPGPTEEVAAERALTDEEETPEGAETVLSAEEETIAGAETTASAEEETLPEAEITLSEEQTLPKEDVLTPEDDQIAPVTQEEGLPEELNPVELFEPITEEQTAASEEEAMEVEPIELEELIPEQQPAPSEEEEESSQEVEQENFEAPREVLEEEFVEDQSVEEEDEIQEPEDEETAMEKEYKQTDEPGRSSDGLQLSRRSPEKWAEPAQAQSCDLAQWCNRQSAEEADKESYA
ncbi:immunoglobulin-like and fibronectin type III domain-containing protein 1 [Chanos chanos]|uniref:immunoglobulin-like and fibronectin type III domain-containing protein 1 n=1 Tax=Chanos chanos TaxID=29144 RepID=UPI0011F0FF73|nr:immunoglobulin-like and fibronectin type III domain-containing protein 1 [Chanos chanos]